MDMKINRNPGVQAALYHTQRPPKAPQPPAPSEDRSVDTVEISEYGRAAMARETGLALSIGKPMGVDRTSAFFADEELGRAAEALAMARLRQLPEPEDCAFKFSPEFERKMEGLIRSIGQRD